MGSFVIIDTAACIPFHTSEKKLNNIKERDMKTLIAFATKGVSSEVFNSKLLPERLAQTSLKVLVNSILRL